MSIILAKPGKGNSSSSAKPKKTTSDKIQRDFSKLVEIDGAEMAGAEQCAARLQKCQQSVAPIDASTH